MESMSIDYRSILKKLLIEVDQDEGKLYSRLRDGTDEENAALKAMIEEICDETPRHEAVMLTAAEITNAALSVLEAAWQP